MEKTRSIRNAKQIQTGITRRKFIKGAAAAGVTAASIGPWFIKDALSSSGELRLFTWMDYSKPEIIKAFEKATGIKVKVTNYSTNQECMNKLRAARAKGFDIAQPSLTEYKLHMEFELYREIDESKITNLKNVEPSLWESSGKQGGIIRGKRVGLPYDWGTEAMTWNTDELSFKYGELSYGTMWQPEFAQKVTCRPHSVFIGAGLYLDAIGKVPSDRMFDTYKTEAKMRKVYDEIFKFLVEKKRTSRCSGITPRITSWRFSRTDVLSARHGMDPF